MKKGPWEVKKEKTVYKTDLIEIVESDLVHKTGKNGKYTSAIIKDGVAILPIDGEGNVYLMEEYNFAVNQKLLTVSTGGIEKNEKPLDAAKRELKEELGIEAKEWLYLGSIVRIPAIVNSTAHLFVAKKLKFGQTNHDLGEEIKMVKMSLDKACKLVMENRIKDDSSSIIMKAKLFL